MMEYIFESRYRHFACKNLESITIVILSMVPVVYVPLRDNPSSRLITSPYGKINHRSR